jgi:fatty acid desaturase
MSSTEIDPTRPSTEAAPEIPVAPGAASPQKPSSASSRLALGAAPSERDGILKYRADRGPVTYVLALFVAHLALWWLATPFVAVLSVLPLSILSMFVAPINHHHQHLNTFRSPILNRLYDLVLALQTGIAPYGWVLHHNLGHHVNYLNQPPHESPDESAWTWQDGTQMTRVEYTVSNLLRHQRDILRVGRKHPKYLRYFLLMKLPLWSLVALGLWLNPLNYVLVFVIPGFITLTHTIWATYEHHAGCHPTSHRDASVNRDHRIYNLVTGNLGLHTAHHKRPGVHWSLLPGIHEQIKDQIPEDQILKTFW